MRRTTWLITPLFTLALAFGCGSKDDGGGSGDGEGEDEGMDGEAEEGADNGDEAGTEGGTTGGDTTGGTTGGTTGDDTTEGDSGDDMGGFINTDTPASNMCDAMQQDCPEGEKCTAYSTDGPAPPSAPWDANKCVPVTGDLQSGDSCDIAGGKYTGDDMCAAGLQCLLTDDEGNGGACVPFCDQNMACDSSQAVCVVYNNGSLPLCLETCDPLAAECPDGQGCFQGPATDFICFKVSADPGEGGPGSDCAYVNACQDGNLCLAVESVQGCDPGNSGCCAPICDVSEGDAICQSMEQCLPVFDPPIPPGFENVGVCSIPA